MEWGNFTNVYGASMRKAVYALHKKHGRGQLGYGPRAHRDLKNTKAVGRPGTAFDAPAVKIMEYEYARYHVSPEQVVRGNIVAAWRRMYAYRGSIRYSQFRPFLHGVNMDFRMPRAIDCSGTMTLGYDAANAKSPNVSGGQRLPYNGLGYTGTLMAGGQRCKRLDMEPGDMVMYGFSRHNSGAFPYGSPTHVAGWEGDNGLHVYSMGSYPMGHYPHNYRDINCYLHFDVTR
jgi:peptidoglycan hydrolase-like protein with peptidoglycan-binding domain